MFSIASVAIYNAEWILIRNGAFSSEIMKNTNLGLCQKHPESEVDGFSFSFESKSNVFLKTN